MATSGLPPVAPTTLPADVRRAPVAEQRAYRAALSFERVLLGQLTEVLSKSALPEDGEGAAPQVYRDLLPEALADGMIAGGGLGLARQLSRSIGGATTPPTPPENA